MPYRLTKNRTSEVSVRLEVNCAVLPCVKMRGDDTTESQKSTPAATSAVELGLTQAFHGRKP